MMGDNFIFQFIGIIDRFSDGSRLPLTLWAQVMGIIHSSNRLFRYSYKENHSLLLVLGFTFLAMGETTS